MRRPLRWLRLLVFGSQLCWPQSGPDDRLLSSAFPGGPTRQATKTISWPIQFEPNHGQVKGRTQWMAQARGASVYISAPEVVFALGNNNAHMKFVGARAAMGTGIDPTEGYSNYFLGKTESTWFTGVPHYRSVRYADVYPGIDVVYHSSGSDIEYDFVLASGADPNQIELAFDRDVHISDDGDLILAGLRLRRPRVMQDGREIASEYQLARGRRVQIKLARYGRAHPLTIDPVVEFGTYLGGPGTDSADTITLDSAGNIFLGGNTQTPASPSLDPFQQPNQSVSQPFVIKLSPDASKVLFFSVFSSGYGNVNSVRVDSTGSPVLAGTTTTTQFPLKNPFETAPALQDQTGFVVKLSPDGRSLVFSSYLGGSAFDDAKIVRIAADGTVYVMGDSDSSDFPVKDALQPTLAGGIDCTISKITSTGGLVFATYFGTPAIDGCPGFEIASDGSLWISGGTHSPSFPLVNATQSDSNPGPIYSAPFLTHMSGDGQSLLFSTYIGGTAFTGAAGLALDQDQNVYLSGPATNAFLTLKNAFQTTWTSFGQGFLMKLDPSGATVIFSTYTPAYGTIAVDESQSIYLTGTATLPGFPQINPLAPSFDQGPYLMKLSSSGQAIVYSTVFVGSGSANGIVLDGSGNAYLVGQTSAGDFPVKNAYQPKPGGGQDIFLLEIADNSATGAAPLVSSPLFLTFSYIQGTSVPAMQSVAVTGPEPYFVSTNATWLGAVPTSAPMPPNNIQISVSPAGLAPGTLNAEVTIHPQSGAAVTTVEVALTVYASPAVITSIDPYVIPIGADDTVITVHGSGFLPGALVYVSGVQWTTTPIIVVDPQTITFKMPKENFSGLISYPITVLNPQSVQSNSVVVSVGNPAPAFTAASVVNAASYAPVPVSVGEIVVVFGSNFGSLGTTTVLFDSNAAKVIYLTPTQLAATVPVTAGNGQTTALQIQTSHDVYSAPVSLPLAPAAPGLFTLDASGTGQAAAINQDNTVNGGANPAPAGSVVALYGTGGGALTADALPRVALPVSATIGGLDAPVLYAGVAPGEPDGVLQINVQVPAGLSSGRAEVVLNIGGASSQQAVTLEVR
jgi:uncharacterized protein (TIGR03437 family)